MCSSRQTSAIPSPKLATRPSTISIGRLGLIGTVGSTTLGGILTDSLFTNDTFNIPYSASLFSIVAITRLITLGSDHALAAQQRAIGTTLAQRKLAEVTAGATPMGSTGYTAFDDEGLEDWQWKLEANQNTVNGVWNVQVSVKFEPAGASASQQAMEIELGQMVLDPTLRGSSLDQQPAENMYTGNTTNGVVNSARKNVPQKPMRR